MLKIGLIFYNSIFFYGSAVVRLRRDMRKYLSKIIAFTVAFLTAAFVSCGEKSQEEITVYMPDGAPALALAQLMHEDTEEDGVRYSVVAPSAIASKVTYEKADENADLCVMPLTAASKLLGSGEEYTMLATLTHGNLYLVAKGGEEVTLSALVGKTVGVLQIKEVPGLTLKALLTAQGVAWQEIKGGEEKSEEKVNLVAISGAEAVGAVEADCFLLAEPAASAQAKKGYSIVGDIQALYGGENGYPQAVLVAKNQIVEDRAEWLEEFAQKVTDAANWLMNASGEQIVSCVQSHLEDTSATTVLKAPLLTKEVLGRCGVRFAYAATEKERVEDFLTKLIAVNDKAAVIPAQAFYWDKEVGS